MSRPSATVNNKNEPLKKGYPTFNGVYGQPIKKGYITKNGVWQRIYANELEFTYTGTAVKKVDEATGDWTIAFLTGGKLIFTSLPDDNVDIFLGGRGANGYAVTAYNDRIQGAAGGEGGYIKTVKGIAVKENTEYTVTVSGAANTAWFSSVMGDGKTYTNTRDDPAKSGGTAGTPGHNGGTGPDGILPFGDGNCEYFPDYKYGAGGGGSGCAWSNGSGGFDGNNGGYGGRGSPRERAGGTGGSWSVDHISTGTGAETNSCSGGGGNKGRGGSGIAMMRNHR